MGDSTTGQVSAAAARVYDDCYLPAIFNEWCSRVIASTDLQPGQAVIDVACGTGALAVALSGVVGPTGTVTGVDINADMLYLARTKSTAVNWILGPAESLPLDDNAFNWAMSQFGLMFFENQEQGLSEMMRVVQPGGSIVIVVWDSLEHNPGFAAEDRLWQQSFGDEWGDDTPFCLGDKSALADLFRRAELPAPIIATHSGTARFESIESWILTGAKGWTEDEALNDEQLSFLLAKAETDLADFRSHDSSVVFRTSAHIVTATKPA